MPTDFPAQVISSPVNMFCLISGLGRTTVYEMIADGRLRAVRVGRRRLLIDVDSWREYMARQRAEGVPEYTATAKAIAARKAKRAAERPDADDTLSAAGL